MIEHQVTCFLPCRKGSQRVPNKNIRPFADVPQGLVEIKLKQLIATDSIDRIVLSTNDEIILDYAASLNDSKVILHHRSNELSSSTTSTDDLVAHALDLIPDAHILWTHVTSPFITSSHYETIIQEYFKSLEAGHDSLMTTTLIHGFLWQDGKAMNYDRQVEKWPRTQTLKPIHEVNSGVFLAHASVYREQDDRIGKSPLLYAMDKLISHDVDWPEDFVLAECLLGKGLVTL
ncbi:acylneuraminate cytidylyltransferase family protein [Pseudomonas sp.]|uniref:acylneuraminate cytidylyltransferase family protein n=1 Tax=Pseudomonas sp. TaxID=306 RepID=UPI0028AACEB4|nr:acylneuraminate cytidylyltransferase family protein [Pseudomonas sp.]